MNFNELISKAKVVVFDLGAVILNIDPQRAVDEFVKLGFPDLSNSLVHTQAHEIFDDFERGLLSPSEFRTMMMEIADVEIDEASFDKAYNSMLLDFPTERVRAVQRCADLKPTYLLSNTNEIHYNYYVDKLQNSGVKHLSDLFEEAYYSHHVGMRKPDAEIFHFLIEKVGAPANDIVFIDDNSYNIATANKLGINTIHITGGVDIVNLF